MNGACCAVVRLRRPRSSCPTVPLQGGSLGHFLLGLKILNMLVSEMNQASPGRTLTQHRKVAVSFRDTALFQVRALARGPLALNFDAPCNFRSG